MSRCRACDYQRTKRKNRQLDIHRNITPVEGKVKKSVSRGFSRVGRPVGGSLSNLFVDESVHPTRKLDLRSNVIGSEGVVSLEGSDNAVPVEVNSSSTDIRG